MHNTIILLKGEARLTKTEYSRFEKGGTIWGDNSNPEELRRWSIADKEAAKAELAKYKCEYKEETALFDITEYALEYCECDKDGDFIQGSDYDLAEEKKGE